MRVLISRLGAYGDMLHCSHLPRLFKEEGYTHVAFETNYKGYQLLAHNPFIDKFFLYEPNPTKGLFLIKRRWEYLSEGYDKFVNLYGSLEYNVLAMEDMPMYYRNSKARRKFGAGRYYDISTAWAGLNVDKYKDVKGEVYYTPYEEECVAREMSRYSDKFKVLINLSGSGPHKYFKQANEVVRRIINEFPETLIITTGDSTAPKLAKEGIEEKVWDISEKAPFREALLIAKYCDAAIGCESGMMVGANMWGVPTIQLMTAASIENHGGGMVNDLSLQSPAVCSPCHKGPYKYLGCPRINGSPACVYFDIEKIMEQVKKAHEVKYAEIA